jgi:hypothetical protein
MMGTHPIRKGAAVQLVLFVVAIFLLFISAVVPQAGRVSLVSVGLGVGFLAIAWPLFG